MGLVGPNANSNFVLTRDMQNLSLCYKKPGFQRINPLGNEIVYLNAGLGDTMQSIPVHRKPLCEKVEYFRNVFSSDKKRGAGATANIREDPVTVQYLVDWVYKESVESVPLYESSGQSDNHLAKLYVLSFKLRVYELANLVIDTLRAFHLNTNTQVGHEAYFNSCAVPRNCPLYDYYVHSFAYFCYHSGERLTSIARAAFTESPEMLCDVVERHFAGAQLRGIQDPRRLVECNFHCHDHSEIYPPPNYNMSVSSAAPNGSINAYQQPSSGTYTAY